VENKERERQRKLKEAQEVGVWYSISYSCIYFYYSYTPFSGKQHEIVG
jgi:hypothetical protein